MKWLKTTSNRVVLTAVVFALLFNGSIYLTKNDLERRAHQSYDVVLKTLLNTTDEALLIWLENEMGTLKNWVSYYRPLQTMVAELAPLKFQPAELANAEPAKQLQQRIKVLMKNTGYLGYHLLDSDFTVLATARDSKKRLGTHPFTELLQIPTVQDKLLNGEVALLNSLSEANDGDQVSEMFIVKALVNGDGAHDGYFMFQLDPTKQFSKMLQLGRFGESGETYAFNYRGELLSESRFAQTFNDQVGVIQQFSLANERDGELVKALPLQQIQAGVYLGSQTEGYNDYRGVKVIGAWQWLEGYNFGVVTEIDYDEAFANLNETKVALAASQLLTNILLLITTVMNWRNHRRMRRFALTDPMTQIGNRKYLENELERLVNESRRSGLPLTVMMLDIDKFKPYNDEFGHQQGDEALKAVANAIKEAVPRRTDIVARYGGEEFCVVLPFSDHHQAEVVANRLLEAVRKLSLIPSSKATHQWVTISVGFSSGATDEGITADGYLKQADQALYQAKALRGNTAVAFQPELEQTAS